MGYVFFMPEPLISAARSGGPPERHQQRASSCLNRWCLPCAVVVPLSVISSWMAEFRRWAPHLRVARVHGSDIAEKLRVRNEVRVCARLLWLPHPGSTIPLQPSAHNPPIVLRSLLVSFAHVQSSWQCDNLPEHGTAPLCT